MPILLPEFAIAYYPVPKNACSSVKVALHLLHEGVDVNVDQAHEWQGTPGYDPAPQGFTTFCVVRDPVERFVSGYRNRVLYHHELDEGRVSASALAALKLPAQPDIETFALNLVGYSAISDSIKHHFTPQAYFLGHDLGTFDRVFRMEELSQLGTYLGYVTGRTITLGRVQTGGPKIVVDDLPGWLPKYVTQHYAGDYALLRNHYRAASSA